ncbi:MAG: RNA-binding protein [Dehalococcoidia bacterium]
MRIYVGNLSYEISDDELREEFEAYGEVTSANILLDRISGRPKGFGFVEMASKDEAEAAIAGLNGKMLQDRTIVVNEARPRPDNRSGGSYGGGNRSFSGGRGGYGGGRGGGRSGGGKQRRY